MIQKVKGNHNYPFPKNDEPQKSEDTQTALQIELKRLKDSIKKSIYILLKGAYKENFQNQDDLKIYQENTWDCLNQIIYLDEFLKYKLESKEFSRILDEGHGGYKLQKDNYFYKYENYADFYSDQYYVVKTAQISPNEKVMAICSENHLQIWDLNLKKSIKTLDFQDEVTAVNFYLDSEIIAFGRKNGIIQLVQNLELKPEELKTHDDEIYYLVFKNISQVISCSQDQTIKISDFKIYQVIHSISYVCSCYSGFDYRLNQNFIIAPNDTQVYVWRLDQEIQETICSQQLFERERVFYIQIVLSPNKSRAIINLFNLYKILILNIDLQSQKISVLNTIKTIGHAFNISYCLGGSRVLYVTKNNFILANTRKLDCRIVGMWYSFTDMPSLNPQLASLNYFISICNHSVYIWNRQINGPQSKLVDE